MKPVPSEGNTATILLNAESPYAQPVCPVGFTQKLAPLQTPVANLVAADTSHLLPHDRSISDSLALAERLTETLRRAMK